MLNLKKSIFSFILLPVASIAAFSSSVNAETLKTKNFSVEITNNCPEGYISCNNVTYFGKHLRTGNSIRLTGKTIHTKGADGVTPSRFLGYEFRNYNYRYIVTEDGRLLVYKGNKVIFNEKGTISY